MKIEYYSCDRCGGRIKGTVFRITLSHRFKDPSCKQIEADRNRVQVEVCESCYDHIATGLKVEVLPE